jgi:hypothetical protein
LVVRRRLLVLGLLVAGCRAFDAHASYASLAPEEPAQAAEEEHHSKVWLALVLVAANVAIGIGIHEVRN